MPAKKPELLERGYSGFSRIFFGFVRENPLYPR
jgi:hypothetical protein